MKGWGLVIETAGPSCQVGLLRDGLPEGGIRWDWPQRHSEKLFLLVERVLAEGALRWGDVGYVVYHQGPGSHTGLRIGLTAVKAWALSLGWKVYAVPLMRVLYESGLHFFPPTSSIFTVWETRAEQWYGQLWEKGQPQGEAVLRLREEWEEILPPRVCWIGNRALLGREGVYLPEVSWMAVGAAAAAVSPAETTAEITALIPLYFRSFVPTQRKP
ncbi:MAG: tRNA (adenosine(37)-N6)-threonylcarbamoyltransferase complex dimerization subunit type 1 TsaB [Bacteroidia bacterium]|nr:tRNA (adenosine(37)-N6)-threonylcarbamoyltransferase complex dimerization subunit type 1 TsaB [Bacteroidia bacterium]